MVEYIDDKIKSKKQFTHYHVYLDMILKIHNEITKDRLWQFLDDKQQKRLSDKLNDFWLELNKIDIENGFTPSGNISSVLKP